MAMTIQKLKEEGEYLGFNKDFGYLYRLNGSIYAYNKDGLIKIDEKDLIM